MSINHPDWGSRYFVNFSMGMVMVVTPPSLLLRKPTHSMELESNMEFVMSGGVYVIGTFGIIWEPLFPEFSASHPVPIPLCQRISHTAHHFAYLLESRCTARRHLQEAVRCTGKWQHLHFLFERKDRKRMARTDFVLGWFTI